MPTTPNNPTPTESVTVVQLRASLVSLRDRSRALLRERFEELHALESRLQGQIADLIAQLESERSPQKADSPTEERIAALEAEVRRLQRLRNESEQALDETKAMLATMEEEARARQEDGEAASSGSSSANPEEVERLQRRLDMALQEIRELKDKNTELSSRAAAAASAPRAHVEVDPKSFDWETQKKRLLQQLESDIDTSQPEQAKEKLRIEEVIRTTDRVVAEKDREIEELKQQIAELSAAQPVAEAQPSVHAADIEEAVRAEKEQLNKLQEEWREKLRKAEVEISIERAKLAREKLQLEDKLRTVGTQGGAAAEESTKTDDTNTKAGSGTRGRWLTRLGLGGNEQPPK